MPVDEELFGLTLANLAKKLEGINLGFCTFREPEGVGSIHILGNATTVLKRLMILLPFLEQAIVRSKDAWNNKPFTGETTGVDLRGLGILKQEVELARLWLFLEVARTYPERRLPSNACFLITAKGEAGYFIPVAQDRNRPEATSVKLMTTDNGDKRSPLEAAMAKQDPILRRTAEAAGRDPFVASLMTNDGESSPAPATTEAAPQVKKAGGTAKNRHPKASRAN